MAVRGPCTGTARKCISISMARGKSFTRIGRLRRLRNEGPVQLADAFAAEQNECTIDIGSQDFDGALHSRLAGCGATIGIGTANQDGSRTQANRFHNLASAAHSSVHQHLRLAVYDFDNLGQSTERSRNAVELASSVIGYDHGSGSRI